MNQQKNQNKLLTGIALAALAALIWSGNFIVARGVFKEIPPISLAFYRWGLATIMIAPFAWKKFKQELPIFKKSIPLFFLDLISGDYFIQHICIHSRALLTCY
jgi:drug/metabolite transporter (DMT)-like permease